MTEFALADGLGALTQDPVLALDPALMQSVLAQTDRLAAIDFTALARPDQIAALQAVALEAFVAGYRVVMVVAVGLSLLSAAIAWVLVRAPDEPHR